MLAEIKFHGVWTVEQKRGGKTILKREFKNAVTNIGKNNVLDVHFGAATQITAWYLAFIDASGFTALVNADTMASHAGWTEFTGYTEGTRPLWTPGAAVSQIVTNPASSDFSINAAGTLKGGFLTSVNVKAGATGTLWGTSLFTGDIPVTGGDTIKITYSVQAA